MTDLIIPDSPRELGAPHDTWRPAQKEIYRQTRELSLNGGGILIAEAPTGIGKSGVVTALGHHDPITACVHTLPLVTQYEREYGFNAIRGRQEYPCNYDEKLEFWQDEWKEVPTVADCSFSSMLDCPVVQTCSYHIAKMHALTARRTVMTYRYMALSTAMRKRTGILVFDEAHDSAEELIRFNKLEYLHKTIAHHELPEFPIKEFGPDNKGALLGDAYTTIIKWLETCSKLLDTSELDHSRRAATRRRMKANIDHYIGDVLNEDDWFLQVDNNGFSIMALLADRIANKIFFHKHTKLLMSATIGNPAPLAHMLGIDDYKFSTFEHPVPAQYRPVFDLKFPRMSKRVLHENPKFYEIQSKGIQKWIQQFPPNWRGVILTSSYYKIKKIMEFMPENERRFIVQGQGQRVNDITTKFITDVRPGDIMVGTIQGMGSGLNLKGDLARWLVIASVANINPTDEYMKVRRHKFGGRTYEDWITYNAIVQAAGRISRGTRDENGEYITNYVALADGKATVNRAMAMYSDWFKEAIV